MNWFCGRSLGGKTVKLNIKTHHLVPGCCQADEGSLQISVLVFLPFAVTGCVDETTSCS